MPSKELRISGPVNQINGIRRNVMTEINVECSCKDKGMNDREM
jgi:hypothetical protein